MKAHFILVQLFPRHLLVSSNPNAKCRRFFSHALLPGLLLLVGLLGGFYLFERNCQIGATGKAWSFDKCFIWRREYCLGIGILMGLLLSMKIFKK